MSTEEHRTLAEGVRFVRREKTQVSPHSEVVASVVTRFKESTFGSVGQQSPMLAGVGHHKVEFAREQWMAYGEEHRVAVQPDDNHAWRSDGSGATSRVHLCGVALSPCAVASCREDDGRPVEVGCQEPASNHPKRLSLRVAVVSVGETSSMTRQVWIRKTNASEPPLTRREPVHDIETDGG